MNEIIGNQTVENQISNNSSLTLHDPSPSNYNSKPIMRKAERVPILIRSVQPIKTGVSVVSPPNTSQGQWRFTDNHPQPQIRTVQIKNCLRTRNMVMRKEDKVKISITPLVEDVSDRQHFTPSKDIVKKQKPDKDNPFLGLDT